MSSDESDREQMDEDTKFDDLNEDKRTIEEIYQKMSPIEHILARPDTYVGSIEPVKQETWIYNEDTKMMVSKKITYTPALYKIFDEILVNAADNKVRSPEMDQMKVTIEDKEISIWNNGKGIPIEIHKTEGVYVPSLIFGQLLTGSNFDDNIKKVTGGRNGYGAKLCNILSKEFTVETVSKELKKKFIQTWKNNMSEAGEPKITTLKNPKEDYTKITFVPDFKRFKMEKLDDDTKALLSRRVFDISATTNVKVTLNDKKVPVSQKDGFKSYVKLFVGDKKFIYGETERWKVAVTLSDGSPQQVSFVNSICTTRGGKHVEHISSLVVKELKETLEKKNKGAPITPKHIKNQLFIFVSALIINPAFDSQTKDTLTTPITKFGSKFKLDEDFVKGLKKVGIGDATLLVASEKSQEALKKNSGTKKKRLLGFDKLDDANDAGTKHSASCTLILTEGDSAKALAISGLSVLGRDRYGVFPLKGVPLNVRDATTTQVMKNAEINAITKIVGLKHGKEYDEENISELRYGSILIMADQDHDGTHIKGLIINLIHKFWPSLLKVKGFLKEFITPIVKVTNKRNKTNTKTFFTIPEYENWREENKDEIKNFIIKYYKGLGTSTSSEAKEYFKNLKIHQLQFKWDDLSKDKIELAFSKKQIEERKKWLGEFQEGTFLDNKQKDVKISDFIDKEFILFSMYDNKRSIPSLVDGLKPGQRKVLFCCFKRKLKKEVRVSQLTGYISEHSAYHHGEQSLAGTIVKMAQDYVGSNNISVLLPLGQFGTRLEGGKDAASSRYIFTALSDITRKIYHVDDDPILDYLEDDELSIEPYHYVPIIPMILVNGSDGIGTGYSTSVPPFNPMDIVDNIKRMINKEDPIEMIPWFKGYKGKVEFVKSGTYRSIGNIEYDPNDANSIIISELPVYEWTSDYKKFLEKMIEKEEIEDFKEYHTEAEVNFVISVTDEQKKKLGDDLVKTFKLTANVNLTNMTLHDAKGQLKKYPSTQAILKEFFEKRIEFYTLRKNDLLKKIQRDFDILDNKVRFILAVLAEEIIVKKRKKDELLKELKEKGFASFPKESKKKKKEEDEDDEEEEEKKDEDVSSNAYNYLLGMPLWSLTMERVEKLKKEKEDKQKELEELKAKSEEKLWLNDLEEFEKSYKNLETLYAQQLLNSKSEVKKPTTKKATKPRKTTKKKKDSDDDEEEEEKKPAPKKRVTKKKEEVKKEEIKEEKKEEKKTTVKKRATTKRKKDEEDDDEEKEKDKKKKKTPEKKSPEKKSLFEMMASKFGEKIEISDDEKKPTGKKDEDEQDFFEKKDAKKTPTKQTTLTSFMKKEDKKEEKEEKKEEKKAPAKKAPAKKAPAKKKKEESEEEFEEDEESEVEEIKPTARSTRGAKTTVAKEEKFDFDEESEEVSEKEDDSDFTL